MFKTIATISIVVASLFNVAHAAEVMDGIDALIFMDVIKVK